MEFKINTFDNKLIKNSPFNSKYITKQEQTNKQTNTDNKNVLLGLKNYAAYISFKSADKSMPPEDFLLPGKCKPDKYQIQAAEALAQGRNAIVTAPTGTGKTAIAHFIIKKNFDEGKKTFYTTPLKALSNQKYHDLKKLFGKENVGILTGDRKENVHAPIVIMTTEIYRNMVSSNYFGKKSDMLKNLSTVVFDEFHYMGDPDRGSVWEESIMFTPENTQILALSATVGNNAAIKLWFKDIKSKPVSLINVPIESRHVPLKFIYAKDGEHLQESASKNINIKNIANDYYQNKLTDKQLSTLDEIALAMGYKNNYKGRKNVLSILKDRFQDKDIPHSEASLFFQTSLSINKEHAESLVSGLVGGTKPKTTVPIGTVSSPQPSRIEPKQVLKLIKTLESENKLPAIAFVFSKKYADKLLKAAEQTGKDLTNEKEKEAIKQHIEEYKTKYGFYSNNFNEKALLKGYAIHSAAILPLQKQLIEELFNKKLLKVAFATETLAAGINMPARTVIMTDYKKPSGQTYYSDNKKDFLRKLFPNEFHQMTGRAGRRGIDKIGYVILMANDSTARQQYETLQNSHPNSVNSTYKLDASSVTGLLSQTSNPADMRRIIQNSFFVNSSIKDKQAAKVDEQMLLFSDYLKLLEKFGFVKKYENGYLTTAMGDLVNNIKGKPQIPIILALLTRKFQNLSPADFAGIIASIAVEDNLATYPIMPFFDKTPAENAANIKNINQIIDEKLKTEFGIPQHILSSNNTNDEIIQKIEELYGDELSADTTKIFEDREALKIQINKEEEQIGKDSQYKINNNEQTLNRMRTRLKQLTRILKINKRAANLKNLLNTRLSIKLSSSDYTCENADKVNAYNNLVKIFNFYNDMGTALLSPIPKISLNPLAFNIVGKWAKANEISDEYRSNWDYICRMLSENGAIKYEGDLFNAISQTIDFIHQIEDVILQAQSMKEFVQDSEYLKEVKENCKQAVKLLKQPPLYNSEEI